MSVTADCVLRNKLTNSLRIAGFQFTDHYEDSYDDERVERSFNLQTSDGDQLEVTWTILTSYHKDYFEWMRIKLSKYNKSFYGNFVIQAEKTKFNDLGSFDTSLSPKYSVAIECSSTRFIRINLFLIYHEDLAVLCSLSDDFDYFQDHGDLRDVTFVVDNEEITAHRQIISARSTKLAQIVAEGSCAAKGSSLVPVSGTEPKVFKLFLRFVYSGKLDTDELPADDLLKLMALAERYMVRSLVCQCGYHLANHINVENSVSILMTADTVNFDFVKNKCIELIIKNKDKVADTDGYRKLVESGRADLLSEIFLRTPNT